MMNTPPMFASLFIISGLGLGLFAFIGLLERLLMPWNRRKRGARREKDGFAPVPAQTPMVILVLLVIWELCVRIFKVKEYILPRPSFRLKHLFLAQPDANYNWLLHIRITLMEIALSFAVTSVLGIAIAIGIAWSSAIKKIVMPAFVFLNSLPVVAVAPLLVLWYGYGLRRISSSLFSCRFSPIVINTTVGLSEIDEDLLDLVKYLHGTKTQIFLKLRIPNSLPIFLRGSR